MRINETKIRHNIYSFNKAKIFKLFRVSFFSFCLVATLVSITQSFSKVSAVESSSSATASVTVSSACSFSRINEGNGNYTGTLSNGSDTEIIGSTFKTICNDPGGYAIYAIGYSNNTLGNTDLIFNDTPESTNNIKTDGDTQTGGNGSYWKMKLSPVSGTFAPTIDNVYNNYNNVPSNYTKVASFGNVTVNSSDSTTGSSVTTSYLAYASSTQPAGTYTGTVKYTMVHPNTNLPNQPQNCNAGNICYFPNADTGNTVEDTMGNQSITNSATSATLWASNFQRPGYGFAGWSDAYDYVVNEGSESNPDASIYGPDETISFTAGKYSDSTTGGLSLYAVWVEPAKDANGNELAFQTTNLLTTTLVDGSTLNSKSNGYVTALRDKRDGQVYAAAKLADGNYWMIENLRLDANYTRGSYYQSLAQGYGTSATYGNFIGLADAENANFYDDTTANSIYYSGDQSGTSSINIGTSDYPGHRMPRYNNYNTAYHTDNMTGYNTNLNVYSLGNYYSWAAAVASTNYFTSNSPNTSICPSGWHLPIGYQSTGDLASGSDDPANYVGSFSYLDRILGGNGANQSGDTGIVQSKKWRSFPNNFVYSGYIGSSLIAERSSHGRYWSSSSFSNNEAYILRLSSGTLYSGTNRNSKYYGFSVRCIQTP